ncbi:uncharacterized protein V6R79_013640 [Siganus canaliculatus]
MCKGTVAFLSDPRLKGKTHTQTHSFRSIQTKPARTHKPAPSLSLLSPISFPSPSLSFLNNSGAERSPKASEGPKLNRPNLASDPGAATRPLGGGMQCIPGQTQKEPKTR